MHRIPASILLALTSAVLIVAGTASPQATPKAAAAPARTPVLVELFTSEGCSDCPPADALLARLQQQQPVAGADIIVLEEHVDYWESLGWHDRFSARQFTDRQSAYVQRFRLDDNYTPQMVVDGSDQFVGSDTAHALRTITQAARTPKFALAISPLTADGGRVSGTVSAANAASLPDADLYAALLDAAATTSVLHGENGGRTLHHVSVVRAMQRIGSLGAAARAPAAFAFALPKDSTAANARVVVFAQRAGQGTVVAAASAPVLHGATQQIAQR